MVKTQPKTVRYVHNNMDNNNKIDRANYLKKEIRKIKLFLLYVDPDVINTGAHEGYSNIFFKKTIETKTTVKMFGTRTFNGENVSDDIELPYTLHESVINTSKEIKKGLEKELDNLFK